MHLKINYLWDSQSTRKYVVLFVLANVKIKKLFLINIKSYIFSKFKDNF